MRNWTKIALFCLVLGQIQVVFAQNNEKEEDSWKSKWAISGYHKALYQYNGINPAFVPQNSPIPLPVVQLNTNDYLYHNRINARFYGKDFTFAAGMRNRVFAGYTNSNFDALRDDGIPPFSGYNDFLDYTHQDGFIPLNIPWFQSDMISALSVFDRFYIDLDREKWHLRVGRQRINWGINQQFNPNDLFNPFNLFDIDYEERPGVDAIRYERYTGSLSSWEISYAPSDSIKDHVAAFRYRTNYLGYDFQAIAGKWKTRIALGGGWSGNIKKAGFSGEFTYFLPYKDLPKINPAQTNLVLSTSVDHAFLNGFFVSMGYLYNFRGTTDPTLVSLLGGDIGRTSPYNPMPFRHTITSAVLFTMGELTSLTLTILSTPKAEIFIAIPSLSYSINEDLDASIFAQIFLTDNPFEDQYTWFSNAIFVRLKQSF